MHGAGNGDSTAVVNHAFVEPVPTPQPPADATATISERDIGVLESMGRANGRGEPAGPPVTGDRDAAPSQLYWELVDIDDLGTWKDLVRSVLDRCHAAGLARGRALGAREALDSLEATMKADLDHYALNKHAVEWIPHFLEAIEARRAGRGA
jgi:hypothetical protein